MKKAIGILLLLIVLLSGVFLFLNWQGMSCRMDPVSVGTNLWIGYEPLYIAQHKGLLKSDEFRIVHLPAYLLYPPSQWRKDDIIKEEFDFSAPESMNPGIYSWQIGSYVVPQSFFIQTEKENLVLDTKEISLGSLNIE